MLAALPAGTMYFKVLATNAGGESLQRDVVAAHTQATRRAPILIVNGFDRFERATNDTESYSRRHRRARPLPLPEHARLRRPVRRRDQRVQPALGFETVQNENVTAALLGQFQSVLWISGEESGGSATFDANEQTLLTNYLSAGGKLFVSGSEIGWDLDSLGNGVVVLQQPAQGRLPRRRRQHYTVAGAAGSIFSGITSFTSTTASPRAPAAPTTSTSPTSSTPINGSTAAMTYSTGGTAAVQWASGVSSAAMVNLAFPFETITSSTKRNQVMAACSGTSTSTARSRRRRPACRSSPPPATRGNSPTTA
jgi:hypothetical protein